MSTHSPPPPLDPVWAAESNLTRILAVTGVFNFLALISVALRLYVRIGLLRTPGKDDLTIVAASLAALGGWICFVLQGYHGLGKHTKTIPKPERIEFDHISFAQSIISAIGALGLLKFSIAFFLLRLSKNRWYTRSLWALMVLVFIYTVGAWLTFFLRCRPMSGFWTSDPKAKCYPILLFVQFAQINTGMNIFTDVCFASLPIPIIWSLQMSKRTRLNLIIILSLGYLAVAMGIVKAVYQFSFAKNPDKTFEQSVQFWGFLQLNVGIIAASAPTLKPLLKGAAGATSNAYTPYYGNFPRSHEANVVGGSRRRASMLGANNARSGGGGFEMSNRSRTNRKHDIYSVDEDRTGSEDSIINDPSKAHQIVRTMEVTVDNEPKDNRV